MRIPHINFLTRRNFCVTAFGLVVGMTSPALAASFGTSNILYLNSTRGEGTGVLGDYRSAIANALDNHRDGTVFEVDFVQTHDSGDLASLLNSKPVGYYHQIWFDTTIFETALLTSDDLAALNAWAAHKQPQFMLDSTFFFRNRANPVMRTSAAVLTIGQALALRDAGGGIFIGTDNDNFAQTANQILTNFGFDGQFTGHYPPLENAEFTSNTPLNPKTRLLYQDFLANHIQGLTTSSIPTGTHQLNSNGGNRTIQIKEYLNSGAPDNFSLIGASFEVNISQPIPERTSVFGFLVLGAIGLISMAKIKK